MKQITLLLAFIFATSSVIAGLPPTTLKSAKGTKSTTFNFQVPKALATKTATGGLLELGNPNELANQGLEGSTFNWSMYEDGTTPPTDGTGGTPEGTCAASSSSPLEGSYSLLMTKDTTAVTSSMEGCSVDFTIPDIGKGRVYTLEFDFEVSFTGTNRLRPYIYDVTNAAIVPLNVDYIQSGTNGHFIAQFQTAVNSNSYRLIFHITDAAAGVWTLKADNIYVGRKDHSYGTVVTDWESFTPTGSWVANTTYTGKYRRVGDSAEIMVHLAIAGAPTSATLTINHPNSLVADVSKMPSGTGASTDNLGSAHLTDVSTAASRTMGTVYASGSSAVSIASVGNGAVTQAVPFTWAASDSVLAHYKVPIVGWGSSAKMSTAYSAREIKASVSTTGLTATTTPTIIPFTTTLVDSAGAIDLANDKYVIPESGFYTFTVAFSNDADASGPRRINFNPYLNGAAQANWYVPTVNAAGVTSHVYEAELVAGDEVSFYASISTSTLTNVGTGRVTVKKTASPQTLMGSEVVAARYTSNAGQSIGTSPTALVFEDKVSDTHNAYNTATGEYTIPVSGFYHIGVAYRYASQALATNQGYAAYIYIDGASYTLSIKYASGGTVGNTASHSDTIYLTKGQVVSTYGSVAIATTMVTQTDYNIFQIFKVN